MRRLGGGGFVGGELVDAQVEGGGVTEAGDEGGVGRDREFEAGEVDFAVFAEGQADVTDSPGGGERWDVGVAG